MFEPEPESTQNLAESQRENQCPGVFLTKGNETPYTPTGDYEPATKKYVDDNAGGVDTTAIHKATSGEINAITPKTTLTGADEIVLEDSAETYAKKKVTISNLLKTLESIQVGPQSAISSGVGTFGYIVENDRIQAVHLGTSNNQDGYIIYQLILPYDCDAVVNVRINVKRYDAVDSFDLTVSKDGVADANMNAVDILPELNNTLTTSNFTPAGTHTAGDVLLFKFRSTCDSGVWAQMAECIIRYRKKVVY